MPQDDDTKPATEQHKPAHKQRKPLHTRLKILGFSLLLVIFALSAYLSYIYTTTPAAIRKPVFQHYHFRMQLLVKGKPVDFSDKKFQVGLGQSCSADLPSEPIHFHDNKSQMVHIHWDSMTGGMVLKYYGWDHIGGVNGALGYRFDHMPLPKKVPIHGDLLPEEPGGAKLYVYTGDEQHHTLRSTTDFLRKDLESFFGKKSTVPGGSTTSLLDRLFPKAYAHEGETHAEANDESQNLEEINNLLGNVVIFTQEKKPTEAQVQARFDALEPLSSSTCGG